MSKAAQSLAKQIDFSMKGTKVYSDLGQVLAREVYYQLSLNERVLETPKNQRKVNFAIMKCISEGFKQYLDARARSDHGRFHHVYEWDKTGNANARLFNVRVYASNLGATARPVFLKSKSKNRNGHIFANKAFVMESGQPVTIVPKNATFLKFEYNGDTVFTKGPVHVQNPGGIETNGSLQKAFKAFNSSGMPRKIASDSKIISRIMRDATGGAAPRTKSSGVLAAAKARADAAVERNTSI